LENLKNLKIALAETMASLKKGFLELILMQVRLHGIRLSRIGAFVNEL